MPTYCYSTPDGEVFERSFAFGKAPCTVASPSGVCAKRDYAAEHSAGRPAGSGWPMTCVASGVNASQAGELRTLLKDAGCETEVTSDGDPVYRSHEHRKRALRVRRIHDRNSFC